MVDTFKKSKKGDIIVCTYISGNQKNLTLNKEYEVLKVNQNDYYNSIYLKLDSGKKVWFNDRHTNNAFKLKSDLDIIAKDCEPLAYKHIGPRTLVIIRMPLKWDVDDQTDYVKGVDKVLETLKNEFAFIVIEDENVETIQFEYPLNHNSTTPLDFLSDSTKIKSL